ncbi:MAG TPA: hypothetical protein VMW91_03310 [Desulfosporosinus sp.]|nr:hypothetical protein [Desulfosporosinus sp.]
MLLAEFTNHPEAQLAEYVLEKPGVGSRIWSDDCGGVAVGLPAVRGVRLFDTQGDFVGSKSILELP